MSFYPAKCNQKNYIKKISLPGLRMASGSSRPLKGKGHRPGRRTAFYTFRRGSLTVEAAFVIPLFLFCMFALISLMHLYQNVVTETVSLQVKAEKQGMLTAALSQPETFVSLTDTVVWTPDFFPSLITVKAPVQARVHAWIGKQDTDMQDNSGLSDPLVYVTDNQSVYHTTSRCTHLLLTIEAVSSSQVNSKKNADGSHYKACEKCVGNAGAADYVYISPQGECWHNSSSCSGLTRSVRLVHSSEVGNLPLCSRCSALSD